MKTSFFYLISFFAFIFVGAFVVRNVSFIQRYENASPPTPIAPIAGGQEEREVGELLPDLALLPPRDINLKRSGDLVRLHFSATYYNAGAGALELVPDPEANATATDGELDVRQRIYMEDDEQSDEVSGTFYWHAEHDHYHFKDFVTYTLTPEDEDVAERFGSPHQKTTFCVRDVGRIIPTSIDAPKEGVYRECDNTIQGVSVGWGDTYFDDYPGQLLDVTGIPSGTYTLSFVVNPERRFKEGDYQNNTASAKIYLDMEAGAVEVLEKTPVDAPEIEHVYPRETF